MHFFCSFLATTISVILRLCFLPTFCHNDRTALDFFALTDLDTNLTAAHLICSPPARPLSSPKDWWTVARLAWWAESGHQIEAERAKVTLAGGSITAHSSRWIERAACRVSWGRTRLGTAVLGLTQGRWWWLQLLAWGLEKSRGSGCAMAEVRRWCSCNLLPGSAADEAWGWGCLSPHSVFPVFIVCLCYPSCFDLICYKVAATNSLFFREKKSNNKHMQL
jgi:hypothetical protein